MCVKVCLICFLKLLYLELKHNFQNHCLSYHIRISRYVFLIGVDNVYQSQHQNDCRLYTQLFVWGCMSYLWYFGMFTYRGVQYGLTIWVTWCLIRGRNCLPFVLGFSQFVGGFVLCLSSSFVLCNQCYNCIWTVHSRLHLWFSITFIYYLTFFHRVWNKEKFEDTTLSCFQIF